MMMQLGTRWPVGQNPPATVPGRLHPAIREVEAAVDAADLPAYWTMTFLEGRPIAELDIGVEVVELADGSIVTREFDD